MLLAASASADEWQPVLSTPDGIQVFNRGGTESGLIEFRGVGVVDAPLPLVATVIFDTGRRREWIEGLVESKILRWAGADEYVEYDHIEMPVFFSDRDFVSSVRIRLGPEGRELAFLYRWTDDPSAPRTAYVRGEVINMSFLLSSKDRDRKTRIDALFLCDPKGWIPTWLVNYFLQDWPQTTFRSLRKEVLRPDIAVDARFSGLPGAGKVKRPAALRPSR